MTDKHADLEPLRLIESKPGYFSLLLYDGTMTEVMDVFEEQGRYGNGYGWETVARAALLLDALDGIGDRFDGFDSEAGMFCAIGDDEEALRELGLVLAAAFHDRAKLADLITTLP